jgi:YD repeat-containing protein
VSGAPINLTNGNTYIQQKDVAVPGLGGGLNLQRTWNSIWPAAEPGPQSGLFGPNWRSTYEESISPGTGNAVGYQVYAQSDGGIWYFGGTGSTLTLSSPANVTATLTHNSTQWTLTFQSGEQRIFSFTSGLLTAIVDRNGNTTNLTYDTNGTRLITITDPVSRHLNFTYGTGSAAGRVITVASDVGLTLSYSYDTQGRLIQVTKPDLNTLNFTYNTQSLITAVTDTSGKTLEAHTYDTSGRGLTSSRANGVDAVTISYH